MRLFDAYGVISFATFLVGANAAPEEAATDVSDRYIITLKSDVDVPKHMSLVEALHSDYLAKRTDARVFGGVDNQYNISDFQAYAGHFHGDVVEQLRDHEDVDAIEPDVVWSTSGVITQARAQPGLAMLSSRNPKEPTWSVYRYDESAGQGTYAYVVDSGINIDHEEFERRATLGYNVLSKTTRGFGDRFGHGTQIAGIIGGKTFGVAKKTNLVAVKVCERDQAQLSNFYAGFQWAVSDMRSKHRVDKSVINVSVQGQASAAWSKAVDAASEQSVTTVLAAGNEGRDMNRRTAIVPPKTAIMVSAADRLAERAPFANWGSSVDIFAPGEDIKSAFIGSRDKTAIGSGTSQASAFVAGLAVYFKRLHGSDLRDGRTTKSFILRAAHQHIVQCESGGKYPFAYNQATARAAGRAPDRGPSRAPDRGPSRGPDRTGGNVPAGAPPGRTPGRVPDRDPPGRAPVRGPGRAPGRVPDKAPPSGAPGRAPARAPSRAPARAPDRAPSRPPARAPDRAPDRAPCRGPSCGYGREPSRAPCRGPSCGYGREPSRGPCRGPSCEHGREPSRAPGRRVRFHDGS